MDPHSFNVLRLPEDLWQHIFSFLDLLYYVHRLASVSRQFRKLSASRLAWNNLRCHNIESLEKFAFRVPDALPYLKSLTLHFSIGSTNLHRALAILKRCNRLQELACNSWYHVPEALLVAQPGLHRLRCHQEFMQEDYDWLSCLPKLKHLDLRVWKHQFTLDSLPVAPQVQSLVLRGYKHHDHIFRTGVLARFPNLSSLTFETRVEDTDIFPFVHELSNLRSLDLEELELSCTSPIGELAKLPYLSSVSLGGCCLTANHTAAFSKLPHLTKLRLENATIVSPVAVQNLWHCEGLRNLILYRCNITPPCLKGIKRAQQLTHLTIDNSPELPLSAKMISRILQLPSLQSLSLSALDSDALNAAHLTPLPSCKLRYLRLEAHHPLTDIARRFCSALPMLQTLHLREFGSHSGAPRDVFEKLCEHDGLRFVAIYTLGFVWLWGRTGSDSWMCLDLDAARNDSARGSIINPSTRDLMWALDD